jgi:tetratricopeptide (TPR) repeat protein
VSVAAALDMSDQDLTPDARRLFRRLGLVPGPSFDAYAAAALDGSTPADARHHLDELYDQHLITEPAPGRYHLHDLLREHTRVLAAADDPAESDRAAGRLLDYYAHTAAAAGRQIPTWVPVQGGPLPGRTPTWAPELSTHEAADAWLDAERSNLHAAVDDAAASGQHLHAAALSTAVAGFLLRYGHWDPATAMLRTALAAARRAHHRPGEADALGALGELARLTGDHRPAAADLARAAALHGELDDLHRQAADLDHLGFVQALTGDYASAVASHQRALALARDLGDLRSEAATLVYLGYAQQMTGDFDAAGDNLARALEVSRSLEDRGAEANALNILGTLQTLTGDYPASAANIRQSLDLFRDHGDRHMEA